MFFALKGKMTGQYISEQSTLGGRYVTIYYTDDIYSARTSKEESTMKRHRSVVNKYIGNPSGSQYFKSNNPPVEEVDVVTFSLTENKD